SALAPRCSAHSNPASPPPSKSPSNYFSYSHWPDAAASSNPRGKQRAALPPSIPSTLNQARCLPRIFVTTVTAFYPKGTPHPRRHLKTHPEPIRLPGRPRASAVSWKPFIHHPFMQVVSALFPPRSGLFRPNFTHEGRGVPTRTFPCLPRSTRTEHAEEMIKRLTLRSSLFLPFSPFFSLFLPFSHYIFFWPAK